MTLWKCFQECNNSRGGYRVTSMGQVVVICKVRNGVKGYMKSTDESTHMGRGGSSIWCSECIKLLMFEHEDAAADLSLVI